MRVGDGVSLSFTLRDAEDATICVARVPFLTWRVEHSLD
jgi:hypothetical protein